MRRVKASRPLGRAIARETLLLFSNFALRLPSRGRQPFVTDGSGKWAFTNVGTKEWFIFFICVSNYFCIHLQPSSFLRRRSAVYLSMRHGHNYHANTTIKLSFQIKGDTVHTYSRGTGMFFFKVFFVRVFFFVSVLSVKSRWTPMLAFKSIKGGHFQI